MTVKPVLSMRDGQWQCYDYPVRASGHTPSDAYHAWATKMSSFVGHGHILRELNVRLIKRLVEAEVGAR